MLKIGVLGAGHLGKIHIRLIKELNDVYEFIGFYDPNEENATKVASEFNTTAYSDIEELVQKCDVIDVVTPTLSHYECAVTAMRNCKHVFIEKPVTNTLDEAKALRTLAEEADVKVQIGHVERFNPAFTAALPYFEAPMFIETHRLAQFNPRGTDVPVVLDLMIHDIDVVLSVVKSNIKRISASGVAVVSDTPDIANARIEFDNGCVANLTASRISIKNMRKSRFFQKNAYLSVDFLTKETEIVKMTREIDEEDPYAMIMDLGEKGKRQIIFNKPDVIENNAIKDELKSFADSINNDETPKVTLEDGYNALEVATQIVEKLKLTPGIIDSTVM